MDDDVRLAIERRAYQLWEAAGRPAGRELEHWLLAERELAVPPVAGEVAPDTAPDELLPGGATRVGPTRLFEALADPLAHTDRP